MPDPLPAIPADRTALLAGLRARIRCIEGVGGEGVRTLPFGVEGIDSVLPEGGLPLGCLHAVAAADSGAGTAFAAALLGRLASRRAPALWILRGRDLHAAGLAAYGLTPDRLIAVRAARRADALWTMEEALRCTALSAVLGEVEGVDLTASRRLQLAAESSGVTGILLRMEERRMERGRTRHPEAASAAVTRWRLAAAPSRDESGPEGETCDADIPRHEGHAREPGVGAPRWRVTLERCRGGRPGAWILEWSEGAWRDRDRRDEDWSTAGRETAPRRDEAPLTSPRPGGRRGHAA